MRKLYKNIITIQMTKLRTKIGFYLQQVSPEKKTIFRRFDNCAYVMLATYNAMNDSKTIYDMQIIIMLRIQKSRIE